MVSSLVKSHVLTMKNLGLAKQLGLEVSDNRISKL
jgi:hypothetical protein